MDESNRKTLQRNNHKLPNLSAFVRQPGLTRTVIYVLSFILIQTGLENLYLLFPVENYAQLHTAITGGILDNILPAFVIFWLLWKYVKNSFLIIIALFWFIIESVDGIVRVILQFAIYYADEQGFAYWLNQNYLMPMYWIYVLVPLIWLMAIRKNFIEGKSDKYIKSGTYLFFKKPKSIRDLIVSFFGGSTATVYPVHKGTCYYFRKGQPFSKSKFIHRGDGRLIKITPPKGFNAFLDSKLGSKYHIYSNNCVSVMRGSGLKIGVLDFIPSIFLLRYRRK